MTQEVFDFCPNHLIVPFSLLDYSSHLLPTITVCRVRHAIPRSSERVGGVRDGFLFVPMEILFPSLQRSLWSRGETLRQEVKRILFIRKKRQQRREKSHLYPEVWLGTVHAK